jgi:alpha-N-acetylglucosaminidase
MKKICLVIFVLIFSVTGVLAASVAPVKNLIERIAPGSSSKFVLTIKPSDENYFQLAQKGDKVVIVGNNCISLSVGLNWYLKYYANVHLSWNNMRVELPATLPPVKTSEYHKCAVQDCYYLNYCTHSYSMAFWNWNRWEREIDWMALHGIDLPLAMVGMDAVWRNVLLRLGYNNTDVDKFVAGPAFQAWWLMSNLEGWGGPNTDAWYKSRVSLQKRILARMNELGMKPVLPGYSGMLPHDARERLGLDATEQGFWGGRFQRPSFLQPTDSHFKEIAKIYYEELTRLYGKSDYYSMDAFHEGGSVVGIDLDAAGKAIYDAMATENPNAVWVIQSWQANPRSALMRSIPKGKLRVLDLTSEAYPQWGDPVSRWSRADGFEGHDWSFCMLLNYGGNVGLYGKMQHVADEYYKARDSRFALSMKGIGLTMEGIENNPVMYELMCELPWREHQLATDEWLKGYTCARYGSADDNINNAWAILSHSIYNSPDCSWQQGTTESLFCARPSADVKQASSWAAVVPYYKPQDVIDAAGLFLSSADKFVDNNNYQYDLIDIMRQAVAEKGRMVFDDIHVAYYCGDAESFRRKGNDFLHLITIQDSLLGTRPEFCVGKWIEDARALGVTETEKDLLEWNARTQITTWGPRESADKGGLRDYAHREWNGILGSLYYQRWKLWLDAAYDALKEGKRPASIDWYPIEEAWTKDSTKYTATPIGNCIDVAAWAYGQITAL